MSEPSRALAIGDIHGCASALDALLATVAPTPNDIVITLGDYVDRGLDSAGVINRIIALSARCQVVALRGNHEEMMLDARRGPEFLELWKKFGGDTALISYAPSEDAPGLNEVPSSHWRFLEQTCRDFYETESHIFAHGGVDPGLPLNEQSPAVLRWQTFPPARGHFSGKVVVCGHRPQRSGVPTALPHAICIDTAIHSGGWLTCLDVATGRYWQANERGETRSAFLSAPKRRW